VRAINLDGIPEAPKPKRQRKKAVKQPKPSVTVASVWPQVPVTLQTGEVILNESQLEPITSVTFGGTGTYTVGGYYAPVTTISMPPYNSNGTSLSSTPPKPSPLKLKITPPDEEPWKARKLQRMKNKELYGYAALDGELSTCSKCGNKWRDPLGRILTRCGVCKPW
jgi:hypothetical protein